MILAMLSVIIPTLNAESNLGRTLAALVPGVVDGLISEVIMVDGGSSDETREIAEAVGARFISAPMGRGTQFRAGASAAKGRWLLFLHADTALEAGWHHEVERFTREHDPAHGVPMAAAFRFALDDRGFWPRCLESLVSLRCGIFRLPYGDQGLLIAQAHYQRIGGFSDVPLMEDVDIVRRIGRRQITFLRSRALTCAVRYRRDGYVKRMLRNLSCLTLYFLRVPPRYIVKLYG